MYFPTELKHFQKIWPHSEAFVFSFHLAEQSSEIALNLSQDEFTASRALLPFETEKNLVKMEEAYPFQGKNTSIHTVIESK